jgi:hypothetical protein
MPLQNFCFLPLVGLFKCPPSLNEGKVGLKVGTSRAAFGTIFRIAGAFRNNY